MIESSRDGPLRVIYSTANSRAAVATAGMPEAVPRRAKCFEQLKSSTATPLPQKREYYKKPRLRLNRKIRNPGAVYTYR